MASVSRVRLTGLVAGLILTAMVTGCTSSLPEAKSSGPTQPAKAKAKPPEGAITAEFFGMHDHDPVGDSWPKAPIGSLRAWDCGVMWREIETAPGVYDFSRLDAIVETAEKNDADVLLVLGQTPPFHALRPKAKSFYGPGASSPPTLESWTAYVRAVAERYAGRPVNYQVWNEANVKGFWRGTPAEMAQLTKAAAEVLSTINPRPKLVAPAFVLRLIGQRAWFDSFYAEKVDGRPVSELVDVVSLQLYPDAGGTPERAMEYLAAARVTLQKHGVTKPIWNTEVNYGLTGTPVEPAPVADQVAKVSRTLLLNAANGVERVYWYGWDQKTIVDTLLSADGGTPSPAGRGYRTVQRWLEGHALETCSTDAVGTQVCLLRGATGPRRVYWNLTAPVLLSLDEGALGGQLAGGEPISRIARSQLVGPAPVVVDQLN